MSGAGPSLPPIRRRTDTQGLRSGAPAGQAGPGTAKAADGWDSVDTRSSSAGTRRGSGTRATPPVALVALLGAVAALSLSIGVRGTEAERPMLVAGILLGMFVGVVLLGLTRLDINRKRSMSGRFADWRIPAVRVASAIFGAGWFGGLLALWRFAIDLSRRFT